MFYPIPNYNNYKINESGIVIDKNNMCLKVGTDNYDGLYVLLDKNIEYIKYLVANAFINNPYNFKYVCHRDGDLLNNHVTNLYWSEKSEMNAETNITHKRPKTYPRYYYEIYNEDTSDVVKCFGREEVASMIQYEVISLKNMVGNDRVISIGPFKGYKIRRIV